MKTIPHIFEMLASIPRQTIDPNSATSQEIADELGIGKTKAHKIIRDKLASGEWERTHKMIQGYDKPVQSYRLKKKSK